MARILIYSDLHLEFGPFTPPPGLAYDVVILAGDIQTPGARGVRWAQRRAVFQGRPVIYVPGNHEYYGQPRALQLALMREIAQEGNVHVLDRDVCEVAGIRFLGVTLWTDFRLHEHLGTPWPEAAEVAGQRMNDFRLIQEGHDSDEGGPDPFRPEDALQEHQLGRAWLQQQLEQAAETPALPTVVVTHHAPSPRSVSAPFQGHPLSPAFASELPGEFFGGARLWVHGHIHTNSDYRVGDTRIICNPRGYWEPEHQRTDNPGFNPGLVVEVG
ncbi:metallophosphoesterase [Aquabacterium sp. A7-Y]|uniref:metallophosphoesterase n=1 Tax=Aquabacterium sp. A7-Y TaxID=1349605 RepID=UPI00223D425F|nr:metallophosphoesterase [Aquabacterium sp. A7-Y]MCW7539330.1 metallophosphoesterase [Aquabacterium sp. A7-Y]